MNEGWQTLDAGGRGNPAASPMSQQTTGLREAREATGLHIAALAAALKVPVKKLEALEAGRYDELPDLTFARALASSACRQLKVDPGPILDLIPGAQMPTLGGDSSTVKTAFKPDQGPSLTSSWLQGLKSPAILTSGVVVLAALGLAFLPDWNQWPGKSWLDEGTNWVQGITRSEPSPEVSAVVTEVVPPVIEESGSTAVALEETEASLAGGAALKGETSLAEAPVSNASLANTVLHLAAVDDSWVEVIDGNAKVQIQRVIKKGDVFDFSGSPPYSVVLGRADAVTVLVRGETFDVGPFARNSVARFQVK